MEKKMTRTKLWRVVAYDVYDKDTYVSTRYFTSKEDAEDFVKKHQEECNCNDVRLDMDPYPDKYYVSDEGDVFEYSGYIMKPGKDDFKEELEYRKYMSENKDIDPFGEDYLIPDSCIEED